MNDSVFEYDKNDSGVTLKKFISGSDVVVIPSVAEEAGELTGLPVTRIGPECFKENGIMITKIIVPDSVKILEHDAFAYCVSLEELVLPETIEFLGADHLIATGLSEAYIPASVATIERPELIDRIFRVSPDNRIFSTDGFGLYQTKDGVKELIAVNASDTRDHYGIAEGTEKIATGALQDISTIKILEIPAEMEIIEEGSLSFTGGRASESNGMEKILVSPDNKRFLIKYDCLCERLSYGKGHDNKRSEKDGNDLGKNGLKLIRYFGGAKCILDGTAVRIGDRCFKNTRLEEITFTDDDMSSAENAGSMINNDKKSTAENISIGDEAFSGCPLRYAYLPDGVIFFGEEDRFTVEKFVLNFGKNGKIYDFKEYDEFLVSQYLTEPRIRMICSRLKNPMDMTEVTKKELESRIRDSLTDVIELMAIEHNSATLAELGDLGFFTVDNIDEMIELAGRLEEKEMTAWFMSYKNRNIGFSGGLELL